MNIISMATDHVTPQRNASAVRTNAVIIREKRFSFPFHLRLFNLRENIGILQIRRKDKTIDITGMKKVVSRIGLKISLNDEK